MAQGQRASIVNLRRLREYWGRLTGRERTERRRGERRILRSVQADAIDVAESDPIASRRGRSEATR